MTKLDILYEDNHIIVVFKPAGILSQADKSGDVDMLTIIKSYLKEKYNKPGNVYLGLVHRLDRPVSGIMVFAKTSKAASRLSEEIRNNKMHKKYLAIIHGYLDVKEGTLVNRIEKLDNKKVLIDTPKGKEAVLNYKVIKEKMQSNWNNIVKLRKYIAIVEGVTEKSGIIKSYLNENSEHIVYSSDAGKLAITEYKLIKTNNKYSMLDITLHTGRKNQIRVHMKDIHHPVVGDKIYSSNSNPLNRLALHSNQVSFIHPVTQKIIDVYANIPEVFNNIV